MQQAQVQHLVLAEQVVATERQEFKQQELQASEEQVLLKFQTLTVAAAEAVACVAEAGAELRAAEQAEEQERAEHRSTMTLHLLQFRQLRTLVESMDMRMLEKSSMTAEELAMFQAEAMADFRLNGEDVFNVSAMRCLLMICRQLTSFV